jgi:hypothetical protein
MLSQVEIVLVVGFLVSFFVSITLCGICYCRKEKDHMSLYESMD